MILLVYLVSSFRTNVVLVLTIFSLDLGIVLATGAYWLYGGPTAGESELGQKMLLVGVNKSKNVCRERY
jgi:hypothetical protein